ncbi:hypothetical protein DK846_01635 [Methanospirillum lacunae]|uniref:CARDB domain-containing protein n=1 Tax=Methanospirillum lacunae TaxID=668570 RepID=A0A2V2NF00_9EURY|nr:hypothetical protein DK846_01635 [Methanospirillum lacunae]
MSFGKKNQKIFRGSAVVIQRSTWVSRLSSKAVCATFGLLLILLICTPCCLAIATNETIDAAGKVTVTDAVIEPSVLMTGDVGLLTVTVENTGTSNVVISDARLISKELTVLNPETYQSTRTIGAGTKMQFSFSIVANQPENIYYPAFYLNYQDAGSLRYNIPVRVETPELQLFVSGIPQNYAKGVKSSITLHVGNAKSVNMTGISIIPSGDGIQCNQTSFFIGDLYPHSEKSVIFDVTPSETANLNFNVTYSCGMNSHQTSYSVPITLGTDKLAAEPLINNIEVGTESGQTTLSGDVSNAGISDAYGVVVSLESAVGENGNPNEKYAIGTITAGDYESFDLKIPSGLKTVPVVIQYKDSSGNQFSKPLTLDMEKISGGTQGSTINGAGMPQGGAPPGAGGMPSGVSSGSSSSSRSGSSSSSRTGVNPMNPLSGMGQGMSGVPVMEILYGIIILIIVIVIWVLWKRKMKGRKISINAK